MQIQLLFPGFQNICHARTNSTVIINLLVHTSVADLQVLKFSTTNTASAWIFVGTLIQASL